MHIHAVAWREIRRIRVCLGWSGSSLLLLVTFSLGILREPSILWPHTGSQVVMSFWGGCLLTASPARSDPGNFNLGSCNGENIERWEWLKNLHSNTTLFLCEAWQSASRRDDAQLLLNIRQKADRIHELGLRPVIWGAPATARGQGPHLWCLDVLNSPVELLRSVAALVVGCSLQMRAEPIESYKRAHELLLHAATNGTLGYPYLDVHSILMNESAIFKISVDEGKVASGYERDGQYLTLEGSRFVGQELLTKHPSQCDSCDEGALQDASYFLEPRDELKA
jgi:hypothetical protein